ncbi:type IV toxin-antitoxin system AbiEi family antitoxin domain-containing protein [Nocardioides sp. LML1-1-1.1]|uniref:type IV toxin-antitoxin system AbiEi family antitoxin domain-containing protein n=1 Tax=Nocardioides sp. LML1-1-1.1 TaxID=3135248 RepID=UPI00341F28BE
MSPRVLHTIAAGSGAITREKLLDLGVTPSEIRRLLNAGELVRLRRGVFTDGATWAALDEHVGRPFLLARAAITTMRRGWVLSHDSAAHAWGLPLLRPAQPLVHVTRPGFTNAWTEYGVRHHLARFTPSQVGRAHGLPALDLPRTAVDIARERGVLHGVVAADAVLQRGATRTDLEAAYSTMTSWPGVRAAREAVALADHGAESVHESLTRLLVIEAGIGRPDTQFPVRTREGIKWCDIRVGNHIVEAHGLVKLRPVAGGGVATSPAEVVAQETWRRERLLRDEGLGTSNVYWDDHWGPRRAAAIERLRRDAAETTALRGERLHERLARDAEHIRREYGDRRRTGPVEPA